MFLKILAQALNHTLLGSTIYQTVLQGKQGRGLHGVQYGSLKGTILIQELLLQIGLGSLGHLLVFGGIATCCQCHVTHHLGINLPVAGTQVIPVGNGIGTWLPVLVESEVDTSLQSLAAQPVGPLVVAVFLYECLVVVFHLVDVIHEAFHRFPVLIYDGFIAKLLPYCPWHNHTGIGPTQTHHLITILGSRRYAWKSTCSTL